MIKAKVKLRSIKPIPLIIKSGMAEYVSRKTGKPFIDLIGLSNLQLRIWYFTALEKFGIDKK
jgi:hypothetical protein